MAPTGVGSMTDTNGPASSGADIPGVLKNFGASDDLQSFASYALASRNADGLVMLTPDDMMGIANLMHQVFIIDLRADPDRRLLFRYSGSGIDEQYGMNLMGTYLEDIYVGSKRDVVIGNLYETADSRRISYLRQNVQLDASGVTRRCVERIAFPASSDGKLFNRLVGMVSFSMTTHDTPEIATHI